MKQDRQRAILDIIAEHDVETQEQMLDYLRDRGIDTTQATVSRDIKRLRLVKEQTVGGGFRYVVSQERIAMGTAAKLRTIFRESVVSYEPAQNLVVLKTMPGLANAAGAAIDGMDLPELVGSLAGDDTVLLILKTNEAADRFCRDVREMLA